MKNIYYVKKTTLDYRESSGLLREYPFKISRRRSAMEACLKATPILITFHRLNTKYQKDYCWPSQLTILSLLSMYHGVKKCRATLNLWLAVLVKEKYIIRRRRIKRDPQRGMMFKSTMYKITRKGYYHIIRQGLNIPKKVLEVLTGQNGLTKKRTIFNNGKTQKQAINDLVNKAFKPVAGYPPG